MSSSHKKAHNPQMNNLNSHLAALSPVKRQLLTRLLQQDAVGHSPEILSRANSGYAPLSLNQLWQWQLLEIDPDRPLTGLSATQIKGPLQVSVLQRALNELISRHESLRTSLKKIDGQPLQVIAADAKYELSMIDLRHLSPEECRLKVSRVAAELKNARWDLARAPLMRTKLLWFDEDDYAVLFSLHHLISDGWSEKLFLHELVTVYTAFVTGLPSPLPPLAFQYGDYAAWQREWVDGAEGKAQLAILTAMLAGAVPPEFDTAPAVRPSLLARRLLAFSTDFSDSLKDFNAREAVTLFITVVTALACLLKQCTRQNDVTIGSTIANRHRAGTEGVIGFFANPLVLRIDISGNPSMRELLQRVRKLMLDGYITQDIPFLTLTDAIMPGHNLTDLFPLFRVLCEFDNGGPPENGGQSTPDATSVKLRMRRMAIGPFEPEEAVHFLILRPIDRAGKITLTLDYDTALFEGADVDRMLQYMEMVLMSMVADCDVGLAELPHFRL